MSPTTLATSSSVGADLHTALDFELPDQLVASAPPEARGVARDEVRLMVSLVADDRIAHARFRDLPHFLAAGDVVVVNASATIPAALDGWRDEDAERRLTLDGRGRGEERIVVHLSTQLRDGHWVVELRRPNGTGTIPLLSARAGEHIRLPGGGSATLVEPFGGRRGLTTHVDPFTGKSRRVALDDLSARKSGGGAGGGQPGATSDPLLHQEPLDGRAGRVEGEGPPGAMSGPSVHWAPFDGAPPGGTGGRATRDERSTIGRDPGAFSEPWETDRSPTASDDRVRLWIAELSCPGGVLPYLDAHGSPIRYDYVPARWPLSDYQTIFATEPGSAEMPSAGRAFTWEVVDRLTRKGVRIVPVLLHTGVASLESDEAPYPERFRVPVASAEAINAARAAGGRIVAVGTTVVRALETVASPDGRVHEGAGWTDLVITPERGVRAVDALLTGLHGPRASHLSMLEAVAGRRHLALTYEAALAQGYLWHEFGDLHLVVGG